MPSSVTRVFERILDVVRSIPRGRVMTYGQVAAASGLPRGARVVGYALRAARGAVPWQRVVGLRRRGWAHITIKDPVGAARQKILLEKERVVFTRDDAIDLDRYGAGASPSGPGRPRPRGRRPR
jgi:methylated-DNA-protein-cysteine methyltransferase-like protein